MDAVLHLPKEADRAFLDLTQALAQASAAAHGPRRRSRRRPAYELAIAQRISRRRVPPSSTSVDAGPDYARVPEVDFHDAKGRAR